MGEESLQVNAVPAKPSLTSHAVRYIQIPAKIVGLGFQNLTHTNITLAKKTLGRGNQEEDLTVNIGELYELLQQLFREKINMILAKRRLKISQKLMNEYSSPDHLKTKAIELINNRGYK